MGYVDVSGGRHVLPDGRVLLHDVDLRVGDGAKVALVGANGTGKTTLLRLVAGDEPVQAGTVARVGGLGVMRQFIGSVRDASTVRDLVLDLSDATIGAAGRELDAAELAMMTDEDEPTQLRYAQAMADWADIGGYEAEVVWDEVTTAALGTPWSRAQYRDLATLSGGEQKRLALEVLLRGREQVLLLDEPDNYLDVPAKRWLEAALVESSKSVLFVSHDRELLSRVATRVVTVEGETTWTHGGSWTSYPQARVARHERMAELRRRWAEEHERLRQLVFTLRQQAAISPDMASRYRAMQTRFAKFEAEPAPPEPPPEQQVTMGLRGGRTGVRALVCRDLELTGLMMPFGLEVFFGERVAVLGSNGSGKSHFLRLLADPELALGGQAVAHTGSAVLGARVVPGHFAQTHAHQEWTDRTLVDLLWHGDGGAHQGGTGGGRQGLDRARAVGALRRYELHHAADQIFGRLSGGQQARFQVLLLELSGATMLLLDEPTDNLDLHSAQALEDGLAAFTGTVLAVTHDRWFARSFDRFLVFGSDGVVRETPEPVWDEQRVQRAR